MYPDYMTTCCKKKSAVSLANGSLGKGTNLHALVKQSTQTRMTMFPMDTGIPVTKSIEIWEAEGSPTGKAIVVLVATLLGDYTFLGAIQNVLC